MDSDPPRDTTVLFLLSLTFVCNLVPMDLFSHPCPLATFCFSIPATVSSILPPADQTGHTLLRKLYICTDKYDKGY